YYDGAAASGPGVSAFALPPRDALLGFHDVPQNIVDPGEVAFPLRFQPGEHAWFEAHAHRHLRPDISQWHHLSQLLIGQARNVVKVDIRIISGGLLRRMVS